MFLRAIAVVLLVGVVAAPRAAWGGDHLPRQRANAPRLPIRAAAPRASQPAIERLPPVRPVAATQPPVVEGAEAYPPEIEEEADAEAPSLEERVAKLEEALEEDEEEEPVTPRGTTMEIGGRIHLDHWSFVDTSRGIDFFEDPDEGIDPENRTFFRRIRLEIAGTIWENMVYRVQVDFNEPVNPEIKDVYFGFTELPLLDSVLIGNQKRPYALDQLNSSNFNVFIERPIAVEAFNDDPRRLGVATWGFSEDLRYNWGFGVYGLENISEDGALVGDSRQCSYNGRVASSPWYDESSGGRGYLHLAVSNMLADPDEEEDESDPSLNLARFRARSELRSDRAWLDTGPILGATWFDTTGTEMILNIGSLQIVGEYLTTVVDRDVDSTLLFHGGYVYVAWFLTGEHVPLDRESGTIDRAEPFERFFLVERCRGGVGSGWGAWQVALRYSYVDLSDEDILGGVGNNVTLGLNWYWNAHSKLQMNAIYGDIEEHRPVEGFTSGHFTALGFRAIADF